MHNASALSTYLGWETLAHAPACARPSWEIGLRTESAFRERLGGPPHSCPQADDECGHRDRYERTTVRIVCRSCGAAEVLHGEDLGRTHTTTASLGYGQPPRRVGGVFLYAGQPWLSYGRAAAQEPHDFVVTAARVVRPERGDIVGTISQHRTMRHAVRWAAVCVQDETGEYGGLAGQPRWRHATDGFATPAAAAKWVSARLDAATAAGSEGGEDRAE